MNRIALHRMGRAIVMVATAALATACADEGTLGPDAAASAQFAAAPAAALAGATAAGANVANALEFERSGVCDNLRVQKGHKLAFHAYASGAQIYRWNGTSWSFVAPDALLFADAAGNGVVGTHYAGPTWESAGGSKVVGTLVDRCTPDPDAIDWLLLAGASSEGPGIFNRVTFIQRVNTVGGKAPSHAGSVVGEEARVSYTTEYLFYRAE